MSGNSFGTLLKLTTCGESHGVGLSGILDGFPSNISIDLKKVQHELDRRRPGQSKYTTQRNEADQLEVISGIFEGKTTGTPIGFGIKNTDQRSIDYSQISTVFRPGHADYTYFKKYGHFDYRGGGRSSARETAMRVAAGGFAKQYLSQIHGISVRAFVSQIGSVKAESIDLDSIENNPFFFPDTSKIKDLEQLIDQIRKEKDSIGAKITCIVTSVPVGWGEPVFDKLNALLMYAVGGINAVKGVEIGSGFSCILQKGSEHRDEMNEGGFLSNHAGGMLGGISTGEPIVVHAAVKPTSSIAKEGKTVNQGNQSTVISTRGRHDPCVGIRAVPIVESMVALTLMDLGLQQKAKMI